MIKVIGGSKQNRASCYSFLDCPFPLLWTMIYVKATSPNVWIDNLESGDANVLFREIYLKLVVAPSLTKLPFFGDLVYLRLVIE